MGTNADSPAECGGSGRLVFQGCLDEVDLVNISWCLDRLTIGRPVRWLISGTVSFLALLTLGAVIITAHAGREVHTRLIVVAVLVLLAWVHLHFVRPWSRPRQIRRFHRRNADKYIESRVILTDRLVAATSKDGGWEYQWKIVGLVVDVPPGLLFLNTARQMLFWLPERVFDDDLVRERVLALCHANGVRVVTKL